MKDSTQVKSAASQPAAKRILNVVVGQRHDDPDTSYLGSYSDQRASDYSIDRRHTLDCPAASSEAREAVNQLERVVVYLDAQRIQAARWIHATSDKTAAAAAAASVRYDSVTEAQDILIDAQADVTACDCGGGEVSHNEYRWFNPSSNYVNAAGQLTEGVTEADARQYIAADYQRMESLQAGRWWFVGVRAIADIEIDGAGRFSKQSITSGGLWGIESDSSPDYLAEVGREELADLRAQLVALGFSQRAVTMAIKKAGL